MESQARVDYQVFPRLAAFAEVAWSALPAPAERDYADFRRRMTAHYGRLDALGVGYRPPTGPLPWQQRPGVLGRPIEGRPRTCETPAVRVPRGFGPGTVGPHEKPYKNHRRVAMRTDR